MRTLRGQRGASAVEFALIAPVLFMIIFAILGFGIAFMQLQTIRGAVREGARISAGGRHRRPGPAEGRRRLNRHRSVPGK